MNEKTAETISQMMKSATQSHPLFAGFDATKAEEMREILVKSMQTMVAPKPEEMGEWFQSWIDYQSEFTKLWLTTLSNMQKGEVEPSKDRRFSAEEWTKGLYPFLHQSYELTAKAMIDMAEKMGLPDHEQRKLNFYTRVTADGLSPSNYALTNPEVLKLAMETNGQSLVDGFQNLLADLEKGYITTTDESAFTVGENLANTPGAVIFRNDLIELLQYTPTTEKVRANPIMIVPPCVNKFYIFDINEKKSMIRYLVEQGHTVFTISWRNPDAKMAQYDWNDYIEKGILAALDVTAEISKSDKIDMLSWCNASAMMLAALAVMPDKQKKLVGTATFLSAMADFTDPGEIEVFVDAPQIEAYKHRLKSTKVATGRDIAQAMAMLHVNESIWGFVINNYLKGKSPPPFDILFWNSDTSNLPAKWLEYYTEEMYVANKLKDPGALTLLDQPVDIGKIDVPCYFVAATGDHIVPWKASFDALHRVSGDSEFILTSGGHVSGMVINHPHKSRRYYLSGGKPVNDGDEWAASATRTEGSWWPHWLKWLETQNSAEERAAPRELGNKKYPELAPAPGTYVTEKVSQSG
ncbi:PHA/PHB synthase family protein [Roseovarius dicentrarchi]|uniref:PHA/PHB synthase family protein n=1 Tax=Roseovarius dicentrarchi TaxID=2250573 RepID=UPI001396722C|nr:alpha/beta fold hydrolase [Roseovarius dicentrarchi]